MVQPLLDRLALAVKRLSLRIESLEYDNALLQDHLESAGFLKKDVLSACTHRKRFAAACRVSPCAWEATLADVLPDKKLVSLLADFTGQPDVHMLRAAACPDDPDSPSVAPGLECPESERLQGKETGGVRPPEFKQPPVTADDEGLACIYMFGGNDDAKTLNSCEKFNPITNVWDQLTPLNQARSAPAAALLGDRIYICGGNHCGHTLTNVEAFDVKTESWHYVPHMIKGRSAAGAIELAGRLYVCGGWSGKAALASCERFNPMNGHWELLTQMTHRREWPMVTADVTNLYVCGGQDGSEDVAIVEQYDPQTNVWETMAMSLQFRRNSAIVVSGQQLYLCGGHGPDGRHVVNSVDRFDPSHGEWEALAPMQTHRRNAMASLVAGRIYVCGGRGSRGNQAHGGGHALRTAERFDPNTGTWEAVMPMSTRRYRAAAVIVPM